MRPWVCVACGSEWGARLYRCPRCGKRELKEQTMPKITRNGGASNQRAKPAPAAVVVEETPEPPPPPAASEVRAWAQQEGIEVNPLGRVPLKVVNQYLQAKATS